MKPSQPTKRPRGHRGNGRRPNGGRNSNFESSGPQGKIRGTAYQVIEKYQALDFTEEEVTLTDGFQMEAVLQIETNNPISIPILRVLLSAK